VTVTEDSSYTVSSTLPYISSRWVYVYSSEVFAGSPLGTTHRAAQEVEYREVVSAVAPGAVTFSGNTAAPMHVNVGRVVVSSKVTVITAVSPPPSSHGEFAGSLTVVTAVGDGGVLSMTTSATSAPIHVVSVGQSLGLRRAQRRRSAADAERRHVFAPAEGKGERAARQVRCQAGRVRERPVRVAIRVGREPPRRR
jgi:hypothetical protein